MEDITTKLALDYLSKELEKQEDYYTAWVKCISDMFVYQYEKEYGVSNDKKLVKVADATGKEFVDFLIKEYASE